MSKEILESFNSDLLSEVSSGSTIASDKVTEALREATLEASEGLIKILYEIGNRVKTYESNDYLNSDDFEVDQQHAIKVENNVTTENIPQNKSKHQ